MRSMDRGAGAQPGAGATSTCAGSGTGTCTSTCTTLLRIQSCTCRDTQKTCRFCTRLWPHTRLASVQRFNARVHAARAASPPSTYRSYNEVRRDADGVEAMQDRNAEFMDLSLRTAHASRCCAPHRALWAAPTGWDTECDGFMRWGCWRAQAGVRSTYR